MKRLVAAGMIAGLLHGASVMASPTPWENTQNLYTTVGRYTIPELYTLVHRPRSGGRIIRPPGKAGTWP